MKRMVICVSSEDLKFITKYKKYYNERVFYIKNKLINNEIVTEKVQVEENFWEK